jgi:DNA repair protein RadA/Sms
MNVLSNQSSANKQFTRASEVVIPDIFNRRFFTGKEELDNVFGGSGFVPGFTFTLAAAPGTGKTTFCLQTLELLELNGKRTAYISGEETQEQLAFTSKRINVQRVPLANLTDVDEICNAMRENKFDFVILDSLPALTVKHKMSSREKEEYVTTKLIQTAKENEICIGVILHFTKNGTYKGSTLYPHSCDCTLIMQRNDEDESLRDIESTKNRFGGTGLMTIEMSARGFTFEKVDESRVQPKEKAKKASKRDVVLQALEEGEKTIADLARETGVNGQYLVAILRDLSNEGVVSKEGKGAQAVFKKL